jgi:G3E family GTPase
MPVIVITGFLGSGKTTLINHLLAGTRLGRVAALVNDFGSINIDAALVSSVADEVVQLTNGCVCCSINGDLYAAVERVLALEVPVDRLVVETTGLADPLPVGLTFIQTDLRSRTSLDAIVTVVDCSNFALDLFDSGPAFAQVVYGDIIILNKADLADPAEIDTLERRIKILKPRARMLRARYGEVPIEALLDPQLGESLEASAPAQVSETHHNHGFRSEAFRFEEPLSAERFQAWLDAGMPAGIFRAKGLIRFDHSDDTFLFQLSGPRAAFDRCDTPTTCSELVFVGQGLDRSVLAEHLDRCLSPRITASVSLDSAVR